MTASSLRRLGRTGLDVTALGLGGAALGNLYTAVADSDAAATMAAAWSSGIRHFDVAPLYGHGLAEHRLGADLRNRPRSDFVLSTKVGRLCRPASSCPASGQFIDPLPFDMVDDYSGDAIRRSVEDSLQRLGLARADILYVHNINPHNHSRPALEALFRQAMRDAYPALDRLRHDGTVAAIGVGNSSVEMCERFARAGDFDCFLLAGRYTLLDQSALDSFLPLCLARGIGVVLGGPFNSGILASGTATAANYDYATAPAAIVARVRGIEEVAAAHRVPLGAAALQFPLAHPAIASVIPGARSASEIAINARWMSWNIPAAFWTDLRTAGALRGDVCIPSVPAQTGASQITVGFGDGGRHGCA